MIGYQRTIEGILTTFPQESTKLTDPPHQESQKKKPLTQNTGNLPGIFVHGGLHILFFFYLFYLNIPFFVYTRVLF